MSRERDTMVLAEASLPSGLTATLMTGHVVVLSMVKADRAPSHFGIALWRDGLFAHLRFASTYGPFNVGGWHDDGPARADFTDEIQEALSTALRDAIAEPLRVLRASLTHDGECVRLTGLNLWTGREFFLVCAASSFHPSSFESVHCDFSRVTFEEGARERLLKYGAIL